MKRLFALLLCLSLMTLPAFALKGEVVDPDDLPYVPTEDSPSAWALEEVMSSLAAGLVPELTGGPGYRDTITREQFAELIVQNVETALDRDLTPASADTFTDTTNPAILKAVQAGIVTGVGEGRFAPTTATNREQIATMIARAVDYLEKDAQVDMTPNAGSLTAFTDAGQVSDWAAEGMGTLAANGIMGGTSATTLSPKNPCTVEQSILLSWRTFNIFQNL